MSLSPVRSLSLVQMDDDFDSSVVQYNIQQGLIDSQPSQLAAVLDKTPFSEFIHEEIDPGPRCPNHLREHFLRNVGNHLLRLILFAVMRQQQQSPSQPFLTG